MNMPTEFILIGLLVIVTIGFFGVVWFIAKKFKELGASGDKKVSEDLRTLHERMDRQAQLWNEHLQNIHRQFGTVSELGRQMRDFHDFLSSPKLRGNVGEEVLKDIIEQLLPKNNYAFQHRFKDGATVDAIIKTDKGVISVDAKFPLDNCRALQKAKTDDEAKKLRKEFSRDVKKHIEAIANKYIQPGEGTLETAFMYVPSETVYYEIINDDVDLNTYAREQGVVMVSPNTFHAILGMLLATLQGQELAKAAQEMQSYFAQLAGDAKKFGSQLDLTAKHLNNAKNSMDTATGQFAKLEGRLEDVKRLKSGDGNKQEQAKE